MQVNRILLWLSGIVMLFGFGELQGQNMNAGSAAEDMINIPPLRMLIDSALVHSPLLKTKDIEITIREMEWKAQRFEWTDFIQPFSEYRFGTVDNYVFSPNGTTLDIQATKAHRFNVGARINLTIFNAINYRSKLKLADKRIELDQARRAEIEQTVTKEVITLWNMLLAYREIIYLKTAHLELQKINLDEAKMLYKSGEVPIMELARITEIETKAREELELSKKEFRESFFLLSEIVGHSEGSRDITTWKRN